jgi:PAS domain S-box-containing protein
MTHDHSSGLSPEASGSHDREQIEAALREEREITDTINRVGQQLAAELDLQKLVQMLTDAATELTDAAFGSFFYNVIDRRGESYMLYTLSGMPREAFAKFPMPRSTELFGPTFRGEGTIRLDDVRTDARYGKNPPYNGMPSGHLPVVSYLAVPVVSRSGEVLGGLFFGHPRAGIFTRRHERIVEGLAGQTAIAIDNARLFDSLQHAREQAEQSEQNYRLLADAMPQIIWTTRADGTLDYVNSRWVEYTGLDSEAAMQAGWGAVIHRDDLERAPAAWHRALDTGEPYDIEYRMRRAADGCYRWHLVRGVPVRNGDGEITRWFGTCTDIHDRKVAEQREQFLTEASRILSSSLNYETTLATIARLAVPQFADWAAVDITDENAALKRLAIAHTDPKKVELAHELQDRYPPDPDRPDLLLEVLRTGQSQMASDISDAMLVAAAWDADHLRLMRELDPKSFIVVPLNAHNRTLGAITFVSAESDVRYTEADREFLEKLAALAAQAVENARLYREAQEANRAKDEFLATVSHELRTPLNAIMGWSRLLRTGQLDENSQLIAYETIERNSKTQAQLIADLLDVSRIITGKLRLHVQPVEPESVIKAAVETVRPAAQARSIRIQTVLDSDTGLVSGDPTRLQQVVWNLLSNSVKFTAKGGLVQVRLERIDSQAQITVSDNGKGIVPEFLPHVFERFRQADSSSTRSVGGLGLGLAIVRHLVEMHGGTVTAESAGEGQGATFTVKLPIMAGRIAAASAATEQAIAPMLSEASLPRLAGLKVLIVDDEADTRELLKAMLAPCGAEVRAAASAQAALEEMHGWLPDILVSDIGMPNEDGYSLISKVRALPSAAARTPAIALTAYARSEDRIRALVSGYQVHVPKPVDLTELAVAIASLAGRTGHSKTR